MTIIRTIGQGGFGIVEEIATPQGNMARKRLIHIHNNALKRRFQREVEYQAQFQHINIVSIIDFDLLCESPWFTMPLAICSLGREQEVNINLEINDKVNISRMIMAGLAHIHSNDQIHRDIKPPNILRFHTLEGAYYYAISDFGLVANRNIQDTTMLTTVTTPMGTPSYMSPECYLDARSASDKSDIYSLGVVLKFIFDGNVGLPCRERSSESDIGAIVTKCTKDRPEERYDSVAELIIDFNKIYPEG